MKNTKKGFTLVELLIVIAIIAILATVSVVGYVSFINKANISADQQIVTQMNKVLQAEKISGTVKVDDVKDLLIENGYNDAFELSYADHQLAWFEADGVVVLYNTAEAKVTYPEKYAGKTLTDISLFNVTVADTAEDLTNQITNAGKDNSYSSIILNENVTLAANGHLNVNDDAKVELDLNGKTITAGADALHVNGNGSLEITGGKIDASDADAIAVKDDAKVQIKNSEIVGKTYAIVTNGSEGQNAEILIEDSTIKSSYIYFPSGKVVIRNTTIEGRVFVCGGDVTFENCTFVGTGSTIAKHYLNSDTVLKYLNEGIDYAGNSAPISTASNAHTFGDNLLIAVNRAAESYQVANVTVKNCEFKYADNVVAENQAYSVRVIDLNNDTTNPVNAKDVVTLEGNTYANGAKFQNAEGTSDWQ